MSNLSNKINSYSPEVSVQLNGAYTLNPTNEGTMSILTWSLSNTAPTGFTTGGPTGGAGYWSIPDTTRWRNQAASGTNMNNSFLDYNYTVGFWFRFPVLPTANLAVGKLIGAVLTSAGGLGFEVALSGSAYTTAPSKLHVRDSGTTYVNTGVTIEANKWYFVVAQRFSQSGSNNVKYYLNGQLILTRTNNGTSGFSSLQFGNVTATDPVAFHLSNVFTGPTANFTEAAILDIYNTGNPPADFPLKYWDGSAWTTPLNKYQWDGVNWITMVGKVWNGSSWINII